MKTKTYLLFALMLLGVSACDKEGDKVKAKEKKRKEKEKEKKKKE